MSGAVEVVGLVLAAFPIVITLLERYQDGYDSLRDWIFFRREFTHLLNELSREQIIFRQQVESMLRTITESEFVVKEMLDDARCKAWEDAGLARKLMGKLCGNGEYDSYCSSLKLIHENLIKFADRLKKCEPLDDGLSDAAQRGLQLQKRFRKLQFVLRRKRWQEEIVDLGRQIDRVGKMFGEAEALYSARRSKRCDHQVFKETKKQASSLYNAIKRSWLCHCEFPHAIKLFMGRDHEKRGDSGPVIKVAFPLRSRSWIGENILVETEDAWVAFDTTMASCSDIQSMLETEIIGGKSSNAAQHVGSRRRTSNISGTTDTTSTRFTGSTLGKVSSLVHSGITSAITIPEAQPRIENLCQAMRIVGNEASLGHLADGEGSFHTLTANPSLSLTSTEVCRVINLDTMLSLSTKALKETRHEYPPGYRKPMLPRRSRMLIALALARAILELFPSPWLATGFHRRDIYFFQRIDGTVMAESPFILCQERARTRDLPDEHGSRTKDHSNALLDLGIVIMEMWFGTSIESCDFWSNHCDDSGSAKEFTHLTAALEWQKAAIDEGGITLHQVTSRCIKGNFGVTSVNLNEGDCMKAVYDQVVRPLENLLKDVWPSGGK